MHETVIKYNDCWSLVKAYQWKKDLFRQRTFVIESTFLLSSGVGCPEWDITVWSHQPTFKEQRGKEQYSQWCNFFMERRWTAFCASVHNQWQEVSLQPQQESWYAQKEELYLGMQCRMYYIVSYFVVRKQMDAQKWIFSTVNLSSWSSDGVGVVILFNFQIVLLSLWLGCLDLC